MTTSDESVGPVAGRQRRATGSLARAPLRRGRHRGDEPRASRALVTAPPGRNLVVETMSGRSIVDVSTAEGRHKAMDELTKLVVEQHEGEVVAVCLTEFVLQ